MSSQLDIEYLGLEKFLKYIMNSSQGTNINQIVDVFPYNNLQNMNNRETIRTSALLLHKFLECEKYLTNGQYINNSLEFTLKHLQNSFLSKEDTFQILLSFLSELFTRLQYVYVNVKLNIDFERICLLIKEFIDNNVYLKESLQILINLFTCAALKTNQFNNKEIYNFCVNAIYANFPYYDFIQLWRFGSIIMRIEICLKNFILKTNRFYNWIKTICPKFLNTISDLETYEFLTCLSFVYSAKAIDDFQLTDIYITEMQAFDNYFRVPQLRQTAVSIFCFMLTDLSFKKLLPSVDDFCNELRNDSDFLTKKDYVIVMTYIQVIFAKKPFDKIELFKTTGLKTFSSGNFYRVTLKAICYLYPKYLMGNTNRVFTWYGNSIINILATSENIEEIISYDETQLRWILSSDKVALKYVTVRFWLENFESDTELFATIQETDNLRLLVQTILTDYTRNNVAERASRLLKLAKNCEISRALTRDLLKARSPITLMYLLKAKPSVPEDPRQIDFFCKVMAANLPYLTTSEALIHICNYSKKLFYEGRSNVETVKHFLNNRKTIIALRNGLMSTNEDICVAALTTLQWLLRYQWKFGLKSANSVQIDFRRVIFGSPNRCKRGLVLMRDILDFNLEQGVIELCEDVLSQYLYVQYVQVAKTADETLKTLLVFLKHHKNLAFSPTTIVYVKLQCSKLVSLKNRTLLFNYIRDIFKITGKSLMRHYSGPMIETFGSDMKSKIIIQEQLQKMKISD